MNRRLKILLAAPLLVAILAQLLFILGLPNSQLLRPAWTPKHHFSKPSSVMASVSAPAKSPAETLTVAPTHLFLQSNLRDYQLHLTGEVTCGGAPCQAELRLYVESEHNPDLRQIIQTNAMGQYDYILPMKESSHQAVDWRLMVYAPSTYTLEIHGRQILTEDSDITLDRTIRLP